MTVEVYEVARGIAQGIGEREKSSALDTFEGFKEGDEVETTKEFLKECGGRPVEGIVVGKGVLPDQEEKEEMFPFLYASTNPYVVYILTPDGRTERLNVIWLRKKRKATETGGLVSRLLHQIGL